MKKLSVAVCLGHEDLDFTPGLKLGSSDHSPPPLLPFGCCSYFKSRDKKNTALLCLTDVLHKRNFLKRLNAYMESHM